MTDTKPTQENLERAIAWMKRPTSRPEATFARSLAAEFAASDAIARRRAITECIETANAFVGSLSSDEVQNTIHALTERLRVLLRAPTSEKAEDDDRALVQEWGRRT